MSSSCGIARGSGGSVKIRGRQGRRGQELPGDGRVGFALLLGGLR